MKTSHRTLARLAGAVAAVALTAGVASAQAIINNGTVQMGVRRLGSLNVGGGSLSAGAPGPSTTFVGLRQMSNNREATADGCLCEGWGVGISGGVFSGAAGGANASAGDFGLASVSFSNTASSAISVTSMGPLEITHDYHPSSNPALYEVVVTIKNTSGSAAGIGATGIRYRRLMDWDIEPTAFNEYVTLKGWGATALIGSSDDGFRTSNVFSSRGGICAGAGNTDFTDAGPCDHGALFDFGFPSLAAGASMTFKTYYGVARTQALVVAALGTQGVSVYSTARCNPSRSAGDDCVAGVDGAPNVFAYGFAGAAIGGTPIVPEPASLVLLATGLVGVGVAARRRKSA